MQMPYDNAKGEQLRFNNLPGVYGGNYTWVLIVLHVKKELGQLCLTRYRKTGIQQWSSKSF